MAFNANLINVCVAGIGCGAFATPIFAGNSLASRFENFFGKGFDYSKLLLDCSSSESHYQVLLSFKEESSNSRPTPYLKILDVKNNEDISDGGGQRLAIDSL